MEKILWQPHFLGKEVLPARHDMIRESPDSHESTEPRKKFCECM